MHQTAHHYAPLALVILLAAGIGTVTLVIGVFLRPNRRTPEKAIPYECGMDPVGGASPPVLTRYYVYAVLMVLFDVEAVFLIPWALGAKELGVVGLAAVGLFFLVLMGGFAYLWRQGDLEWD